MQEHTEWMPDERRETTRGFLTLRSGGASERYAYIADLEAAISAIGIDRLSDVIRALGWLDRIVALQDLKEHIRPLKRRSPNAHGRNIETIAWMEFGAMAELCDAIAAIRAGLSASESQTEAWRELSSILDRWQDLAALRHFREQGGFHLHRKPIADGLKALASKGKPVPLFIAEGELLIDLRMPLAGAAIFALKFGSASEDEIKQTIDQVESDIGRVMDLVQAITFQLLKQAKVV